VGVAAVSAVEELVKGVLAAKGLLENLLRSSTREARARPLRVYLGLAVLVVTAPLVLVGEGLVSLADRLEILLGQLLVVRVLVRVEFDSELRQVRERDLRSARARG
jgi:hypothetical protein